MGVCMHGYGVCACVGVCMRGCWCVHVCEQACIGVGVCTCMCRGGCVHVCARACVNGRASACVTCMRRCGSVLVCVWVRACACLAPCASYSELLTLT